MSRTGARSDPGRVRQRNEDRWIVREQRGVTLLAVADGVGGEGGGEIASDAAIGTLAARFFAGLSSLSPGEALAAAMREANDAVLKASAETGNSQAASTLVAVAVRGRDAAVANLGDSRAYLVRDGEARQLTRDHTGARPREITRFVGDARGVQPDVFVERLRRGDRLVLCSDGLTHHVGDEEIASRTARADPVLAANALVDLANERGGADNVTVLVHRASAGRIGAALGTALLLMLLLLGVAGAIAALTVSGSGPPPPASPSPTP